MSKYTEDRTVKMIDSFDQQGINPFFRVVERCDATRVTLKGSNRSLINIGSNNYLGLTHNAYVIQKAQEALMLYGTGCTGSRFLSGNYALHEQLEERLAKFLGYEAVLLFATGMQANLGALGALRLLGLTAYSDSENHASIVDGLRRDRTFHYKHNDVKHLHQLLVDKSTAVPHRQALIVTDGVFSMSGDVAPLCHLRKLADEQSALLYVDDAHGLGVLGHNGRGTADYLMCAKPDITMGTFSKAFASVGGFVAASKEMIDYIKLHARSLIFSAALPPVAAATILACLDIIEGSTDLQTSLYLNTFQMRKGLENAQYISMKESSSVPIIPIYFKDNKCAIEFTKLLEMNGVFATPAIYPATETPLIRVSLSAAHTSEQISRVHEVFNHLRGTYESYSK